MQSSPSNPKRWPALLLLFVAICPPLATWLGSLNGLTIPGVTNNPLKVIGLFVLYEFFLAILGIAVKIWQRLEGTWLDQLSQAFDHFVQRLLARYYRQYKLFFYYEHRDLDVKGLSTQGIFTLDLEQVFVELSMDSKPLHQASTDPLHAPEALRKGNHSIWEYLRSPSLQDQHLAILGPPGCGKTTLVKHVALTLLKQRKAVFKNRLPMLPVLLYLRDHSRAINEGGPTYLLADAVRAQTGKWKRVMPPNWIERHLNKGHCLILLDGLDEVADPQVRQQVGEWVRQQMLIYPQNRFVITSRPFGYRTNPLEKMMVLEVQPFTPQQVKKFIHKWYLANEIKSAVRDDLGVRMKAEEGAEDLLGRLQKTPMLMDLVVNPLLLTMIATVHKYRGSLPGTRIMLYREICEVFLGKRQEARGVRQELRVDQRQLALQVLAYQMMLDGVREVTSERAHEIIQEVLQRISIEMTPEAFLQSIEQVSGLVLERENGVLTFAHLTFQEYLTVIHIRENHLEDMLVDRVEVSWWHEVIRLYCAQAEASRLIEACLKKADSSVQMLILARECLEEAREVRADIKRHVNIILEQRVEDQDPVRRHIVAEALLAQRLQAMVPTATETYRDLSLITCAEYQLFLDEQQAKEKWYQPHHWETRTFEIGQALQPVVGVSPSAAVAFCTWLSERESGVWEYRLPTRSECPQQEEIHITNQWNKPLGFWIEDGKEFVWARSLPFLLKQRDAECAQQFRPLDLDLDNVSEMENYIGEIDTNALASILAQAHLLANTLDSVDTNDLISALNLAHANVDGPVLGLAHLLANASTQALELTNDLADGLNLTGSLAQTSSFARDFVQKNDSDFALFLANSLIKIGISVFNFGSFRLSKKSHYLTLAQILTLLSTCISYTGYQLIKTKTAAPSLFKRIVFSFRPHTELNFLQEINRSVEITKRLQLFAKRLRHEEDTFEGIFLVRSRKSINAVNYAGKSFRKIAISRRYLIAKRVMDLTIILLLTPMLLIFTFLVAILIKLESHGPIFFRQKRIGLDGREFSFLKFRSMYVNSDDAQHRAAIARFMAGENLNTSADTSAPYKLINDRRITRVGRFLRATSLDELPQFFNVLQGNMTLVGPRPPLPYEIEYYTAHDMLRLSGKPGLTGFWQVYGRSRVPFRTMVEMDIAYLQRQNILEDLKLIALTIPTMFLGQGS